VGCCSCSAWGKPFWGKEGLGGQGQALEGGEVEEAMGQEEEQEGGAQAREGEGWVDAVVQEDQNCSGMCLGTLKGMESALA
jgi:hypothetical protein